MYSAIYLISPNNLLVVFIIAAVLFVFGVISSLTRNGEKKVEKAVREGEKVKKGALIRLIRNNMTDQGLIESGLRTVDDQAELLRIDDAISAKNIEYRLAFAKRASELAQKDSSDSPKLYERTVSAINELNKVPLSDDRQKEITSVIALINDPEYLLKVDCRETEGQMLAFVKKASELVKKDPTLLPRFNEKAMKYITRKLHNDVPGQKATHTDYRSAHSDGWQTGLGYGSSGDCHSDSGGDHTDSRIQHPHRDHSDTVRSLQTFRPVFTDKGDI